MRAAVIVGDIDCAAWRSGTVCSKSVCYVSFDTPEPRFERKYSSVVHSYDAAFALSGDIGLASGGVRTCAGRESSSCCALA